MTQRLRAPFCRQLCRRIRLFSTSVGVLGLTALLHGQALPKAPGAEVFFLTPTPGYFTEPAIAINPVNSQQVVAVFQDNAHASYSQDAGHTWHPAEGVEP
ncbi:MAG TPA: hypothetical protein VMU26_18635, partial [Candidatus Polarisedimenticolia bacterium]|nr:hypothetical protein [Candidatus Polarisedimenticolia bacterium]